MRCQSRHLRPDLTSDRASSLRAELRAAQLRVETIHRLGLEGRQGVAVPVEGDRHLFVAEHSDTIFGLVSSRDATGLRHRSAERPRRPVGSWPPRSDHRDRSRRSYARTGSRTATVERAGRARDESSRFGRSQLNGPHLIPSPTKRDCRPPHSAEVAHPVCLAERADEPTPARVRAERMVMGTSGPIGTPAVMRAWRRR